MTQSRADRLKMLGLRDDWIGDYYHRAIEEMTPAGAKLPTVHFLYAYEPATGVCVCTFEFK